MVNWMQTMFLTNIITMVVILKFQLMLIIILFQEGISSFILLPPKLKSSVLVLDLFLLANFPQFNNLIIYTTYNFKVIGLRCFQKIINSYYTSHIISLN
jgi:hypothetical protein